MRLVQGIYRYPVKGLSPQAVRGIELEAGRPFPFDRIYALARPNAPVDPDQPQWAKKGMFVMLMLDEALAQVQTRLDIDTLQFTVSRNGQNVLSVDLHTAEGRQAVESCFHALAPRLDAPPRLVRAEDGHFMDKPDNVLSLINLATVRSLEAQWGYAIDPLRFRANFYVDGLRPWEEFDWIGGDIQLGDVLFKVDRRNGRCGATNVNPANGQRDLDIPGSLRNTFGHKDLGVYLIAQSSGKVVIGDALIVPDAVTSGPTGLAHGAASPLAPPAQTHSRFICRGCYLIYDEATGVPRDGIAPGTRFTEIPADWRCPDCGTDKSMFRLCVATDIG